jgi:DNA helicase-2/ATP-dependent DNA helicase PcrA
MTCAKLLAQSNALLGIISDAYPVIILDEFQDTNAEEWELIRVLGKKSRLIALADPEQRIYEFRGADPARLGEFIDECNPTPFDFGSENHRSKDTDIVQFGNDLLTGRNKGKIYNNVHCVYYEIRKGNGKHLRLKTTVLNAYKRLTKTGRRDWSLAVLVPSNNLMLEVSSYLENRQSFGNSRGLTDCFNTFLLFITGVKNIHQWSQTFGPISKFPWRYAVKTSSTEPLAPVIT